MTERKDLSDFTIQVLISQEIMDERERQDTKFGFKRNHSPAEWLMILGEEVGEANKAALERHFNMVCPDGMRAYRKELVQVAAVAMAAIESLDRQAKEEPVPF